MNGQGWEDGRKSSSGEKAGSLITEVQPCLSWMRLPGVKRRERRVPGEGAGAESPEVLTFRASIPVSEDEQRMPERRSLRDGKEQEREW